MKISIIKLTKFLLFVWIDKSPALENDANITNKKADLRSIFKLFVLATKSCERKFPGAGR